jgi:hypothetical protein
MSRVNSLDSGFKKKRSRAFKKRYWFSLIAIALVSTVFFGVPMLLQNRELAVSLINRNAGMDPMRIDLKSIDGGWFRPITLKGLRLIDDRGGDLVQVGEIQTQLTLISLIANYRNLERLRFGMLLLL